MSETNHPQDVKTFISTLNPGQMKTALEYYMQHSSPLEELIITGNSIFELVKAGLQEEDRELLFELEETWEFWKTLC